MVALSMIRRGHLRHAETTGLGINELLGLAECALGKLDVQDLGQPSCRWRRMVLPVCRRVARSLGLSMDEASDPSDRQLSWHFSVLHVACGPPGGVQLVSW